MRKVVRFLLLAAVLAALGLLPFRATDAAKLIPVRAVIVTRDGEAYTVDVGQAVRGVGRTLTEALAAYFETEKAKVTTEWHAGGHDIRPNEIDAIRTFFEPYF